jgi:two-component system chemotaxis response regulator CheY
MEDTSVSYFNFFAVKTLIVEDNDFVRFMLKKYLTTYGVTDIFEAANGEEGIKMLPLNPDIIICDIHMSPLDGFNFLKHVRSLPTIQNKLPFIFLTANADAEFVHRAKTLTVDAYLLKPITSDNLKNKMIALLINPAA